MEEKPYKNIFIYDVSYKFFVSAKYLELKFKYLELFGFETYNAIFVRIRYLIGLKSSITYAFSHNYSKIKIDSDDDLVLEEKLTFHQVIKSVFNKNQYHPYYNKILEKPSYQLARK